MIRILSKAKFKVPIGYTTHNGFDRRIKYCASREDAKSICKIANAKTDLTNKERMHLIRNREI